MEHSALVYLEMDYRPVQCNSLRLSFLFKVFAELISLRGGNSAAADPSVSKWILLCKHSAMLRRSWRRWAFSTLKKTRAPWEQHVLLATRTLDRGRGISAINPLPVDSESDGDRRSATWDKVRDTVFTTTATLICLGIAGYGYHKYYKWVTLRKIEKAFQPGDPALDLIPKVIEQTGEESSKGGDNSHFVIRY